MHTFLKRIELQGFKSFAQKTVFELPNLVVAVVGPNGSGKSNVLDALRWVLGEREAKQLRGDTLEHLIFAGTPKRPQAGFARVALVFDNREHLFEIPAAEVVLARRIDRSGVSEFSLNDDEIKLKDLIPVLARARLGARGLTMIGQGQSDLFVKSSPEDRRGMVEEVLGLREFRVKKMNAERRLVTSAVNMDKIRAMLEEILPHLRFLRKQKHRFEKRSEIEHALREIENAYFGLRYHELVLSPTHHAKDFAHDTHAREVYIKEITTAEAVIKELNVPRYDVAIAKQLRTQIEVYMQKRATIERARALAEAKQEIESRADTFAPASHIELTHTIEALTKEIEEMLTWDELHKIKTTLTAWHKKLKTFSHVPQEREKSASNNLKEYDTQIKVCDDAITEIRAQEEALLLAQEKATREFRTHIEALELKKNALRDIDAKITAQRFEEEKMNVRREELIREWRSIGRHEDELASLPLIHETLDRGDAERKMVRLRGELAAIGEIDPNLMQEAEETETRAAFLEHELHDLEKASKDLKTLIRDLDHTIHAKFKEAFKAINDEFQNYFQLMFGGGKAKMKLKIIEKKDEVVGEDVQGKEDQKDILQETASLIQEDPELSAGIEIDLTLPRKRITSLDMLSGGEKSLVSLAALFALIAVSPPPFLVLDEIDAPLDEQNAKRFSELIKNFASKTQFIIVTHNRTTMEAADILYGVTMGDDGVSKLLSLKLE